MESKKFTYKGESFMKPDNISSNLAKRVIDECGKDYCITVQAVINLLSKELKHLPAPLNRAEIEQDFKEINYSLDDLCRNPDRKDAGHAWIAFTDKFAAFRRKIMNSISVNPKPETQKEIISCICLSCGVRNDHSTSDGFCKNGHDNWLEYRDIYLKNEFFDYALKITGLTADQLIKAFLDNSVKQIAIFKNLK